MTVVALLFVNPLQDDVSGGGVVEGPGAARVVVPAGSMTEEASLVVSEPSGVPGVGVEGVEPVGPVVRFEVSDGGLVGPVTIEVPFDTGAVRGSVDEVEVVAAVFVEGLGWVPVDGTVDWDAGVVAVETDHLSDWRVLSWLIPTVEAPDVPVGPTIEELVSPYVALGDSYAAGQGLDPYEDGTDVPGVNECHRSTLQAYPVLLAADLGVEVISRACLGAKIINVLAGGLWDQAAQLDWLSKATTKIVTISIGGNDAGFAEIIRQCVRWDCRDHYTSDDGDVISQRIADLEPVLVKIFREAREGSGDAPVYVQGYPHLFPSPIGELADPGSDNAKSTPAVMASKCQEFFNPSEIVWVREKVTELNSLILSVAEKTQGVIFVDLIRADQGDGFNGHEVCTPHPWVTGIVVSHPSYSFHPNAEGQRAIADLIGEQLTESPSAIVETSPDPADRDDKVTPFVGKWRNVDKDTQSITRIEVRQESATLVVHAWGACTPTDCDWGETTTPVSDALDGVLAISWDHDFSIRSQTLKLLGGRLEVVTNVHFVDDSERADYEQIDYFDKSGKPAATSPDPKTLQLRIDGLGIVNFGDSPETVIAALKALLGTADEDTGWVDSQGRESPGTCPPPHVRVLRFGGLHVYFTDGSTSWGAAGQEHFFLYLNSSFRGTSTTKSFTTDRGLKIGDTAEVLKSLYGDDVTISSSDEEGTAFFDGDYYPGQLSGWFDNQGLVSQIIAGTHCGE